MKQYKILKDLPNILAGIIKTNNEWCDWLGITDCEEYPEWFELIPETPKMEVLNGYSDTGYYFTTTKQGGNTDVKSILIRNPTPEAIEIINGIKEGRVKVRYIENNFENGNFTDYTFYKEKEKFCTSKIYLICKSLL